MSQADGQELMEDSYYDCYSEEHPHIPDQLIDA